MQRCTYIHHVHSADEYMISVQAGSRRGSRRAMLCTYVWLKLSQTDTQMDRWMDRHCATIRA